MMETAYSGPVFTPQDTNKPIPKKQHVLGEINDAEILFNPDSYMKKRWEALKEE